MANVFMFMLAIGLFAASSLAEMKNHQLFIEGKPTWFKLQPASREEVVQVKRAGKLIVGTIEQDFSGAYSGTKKLTFIKEGGKVYVSDSGPLYSVKGGTVIIAPYSSFPSQIMCLVAVRFHRGKFSKISEATELTGFDGRTVTGWFSSDAKGKPLDIIEFGDTQVPYGQAFSWTNGKRKLLNRVKLVSRGGVYGWP